MASGQSGPGLICLDNPEQFALQIHLSALACAEDRGAKAELLALRLAVPALLKLGDQPVDQKGFADLDLYYMTADEFVGKCQE